MNGFLRMRPVFFRMLPTFESSFFSSTFGLVGVGAGLAAAFLTGNAAGTAEAAAGLAGSGFGSSADGCASGLGFTSGIGFDVVAALGAGGV